MASDEKLIKRVISPKENILVGDNVGEIDHLGFSVYSKTLANIIYRAESPFSVGIFAPFGSGKSFIVHQTQGFLKKLEKECGKITIKHPARHEKKRRMHCFFYLLAAIIVSLFVASLAVITYTPRSEYKIYSLIKRNSSQSVNDKMKVAKETEVQRIRYNLVVVFLSTVTLIMLLFLVALLCHSSCVASAARVFRLIFFVAFTKLPPLNRGVETLNGSLIDSSKTLFEFSHTETFDRHIRRPVLRKFIFVKFSAWQYSGSDILWAAIITGIMDEVEQKIGVIATRLFRTLTVEEYKPKSKKCFENESIILHSANKNLDVQHVTKVARSYGKVDFCAFSAPGSWKITFSKADEAKNFHDEMKLSGVRVECASKKRGNCVVRMSKLERSSANQVTQEDTTSTELPQSDASNENNEYQLVTKSLFAHMISHPKRICCGIPLVVACFVFAFSLLCFPFAVNSLVAHLNLDVIRNGREVPVHVQLLSWLPPVSASLLVVFKLAMATLQSQVRRFNRTLDNSTESFAKQLGFMYKVKSEVEILEQLLQVVRTIEGVDYKVVISIDDLDRCPMPKIKSLLESVHILLSNQHSPFVSIIAVDPKLAELAFQVCPASDKQPLLQERQVKEKYLDKIINVPFYLPKLANKEKQIFLSGLLNDLHESHYDVTMQVTSKSLTIAENKVLTSSHITERDVNNWGDGKRNSKDGNGDNHCEVDTANCNRFSSLKRFFFECRKFLIQDELLSKYLNENPRTLKRIFNDLNISCQLIFAIHKHRVERQNILMLRSPNISENAVNRSGVVRSDVSKLVYYVIMCRQWPRRSSYLLQVIHARNLMADVKLLSLHRFYL